MRPILGCEEVARLEDCIEAEGTTKASLMELAGEFTASVVSATKPKHVLVLVGFGNNGGDGWVAADVLAHNGIAVDVVSPVEPDEIPAALARHVARRTAGRDVNVVVGPSRDELSQLISQADVVVDAILGTGFHGSLRHRSPFGFLRSMNLHLKSFPSTCLLALMPKAVSSSKTAFEPRAPRRCSRPRSGCIVPMVRTTRVR